MFADLLDCLSLNRQVIADELQGHGHTRHNDRQFSFEGFGDNIARLINYLNLGQADLRGYSLGRFACLHAAIQHPDRVHRLALVSTPDRRDGWFAGGERDARKEHLNNYGATSRAFVPIIQPSLLTGHYLSSTHLSNERRIAHLCQGAVGHHRRRTSTTLHCPDDVRH